MSQPLRARVARQPVVCTKAIIVKIKQVAPLGALGAARPTAPVGELVDELQDQLRVGARADVHNHA